MSGETDAESPHDNIHFRSQSDAWATPPELVDSMAAGMGGFDLDPCSGAEQSPYADHTFTEDDDGLEQPWFGTVWMNPPYSNVGDDGGRGWMWKAWSESRRDDVQAVMCLVPSRTSTQWWHDYVTSASVICFIEGRLKFGGSEDSAPFPSAIIVFGSPDDPEAMLQRLEHWGQVVELDEAQFRSTMQASLDV